MPDATDVDIEALAERVFNHYGWEDADEAEESELWQRTKKEEGSNLKTFLALSQDTDTGQTIHGRFLDSQELTEEDEDGNENTVGHLVRLLLEPGQDIYGPPVRRVRVDEDENPEQFGQLDPVQVGSTDFAHDLEDGYTRFQTGDATTLSTGSDDQDFPSPTLEDAWDYAHEFNDRGVINGEARISAAVVTLGDEARDEIELTRADDVDWLDETRLRAVMRDDVGSTVRGKLPIEQVENDFGVDVENDSYYDVAEAIEGQRALIRGRLGALAPVTPDDQEDLPDVLTLVENFHERDLLTVRDRWNDGEDELYGLDLTGEDSEGNDLDEKDHITVNGVDIFDLRQEGLPKDDPDNWEIYTHQEATGNFVWVDVREQRGTWTDDDGNEREWVNNEGAFIVFLRPNGILDENDPMRQAAEEAGLL